MAVRSPPIFEWLLLILTKNILHLYASGYKDGSGDYRKRVIIDEGHCLVYARGDRGRLGGHRKRAIIDEHHRLVYVRGYRGGPGVD